MRRVFRTTESLRRANRCAVAELALYLLLAAACTGPLVREVYGHVEREKEYYLVEGRDQPFAAPR